MCSTELPVTGRKQVGLEGMSTQRNLGQYLSWTPGVAATAEIMRQDPISSCYQEYLVLRVLILLTPDLQRTKDPGPERVAEG